MLLPNSLETMTANSESRENKAIIVAAIKAVEENKTTYSGHNKNGLITPNGNLQPCDTFNGNCVLIPRYVFLKVGNLDWKFRHAIGDLDYGYRAKNGNRDVCIIILSW